VATVSTTNRERVRKRGIARALRERGRGGWQNGLTHGTTDSRGSRTLGTADFRGSRTLGTTGSRGWQDSQQSGTTDARGFRIPPGTADSRGWEDSRDQQQLRRRSARRIGRGCTKEGARELYERVGEVQGKWESLSANKERGTLNVHGRSCHDTYIQLCAQGRRSGSIVFS
jgi:hypothetical protein